MARLLAIDSAGPVLGVALGDESGSAALVHCEGNSEESPRHIETIATRVQMILEQAGWTATSLTAVVVSAGPGSFTGLRIGYAAAKGISLGAGIPVVAVNTLEAIACGVNSVGDDHHGSTATILVPMTDARKGRCYAALFRQDTEGPSERATVRPLRLTPDLDVTVKDLAAHMGDFIAGSSSGGGSGSGSGVGAGAGSGDVRRDATSNGWPARISWRVAAPPGYAAADELLSLLPPQISPPASLLQIPRDAPVRGVLMAGAGKLRCGDTMDDYAGPEYLRTSDIGTPRTPPRFTGDPPVDLPRH